MDLIPVLIILAAGVLHATWNLLVKSSEDRLIAVWAVFVGGAVTLAPLSFIWFDGDWSTAWRNAASSGVVHLVYLVGLARAYDNSDLSSAYPIARGVAPGLAAIGGIVFLGESLDTGQVIAVIVIAAGLLALAIGANRRGSAYAILTGAVIALYSVVDSAGVRLHGDALGYTGGVYLSIALFQAPLVVRMKGYAATVDGLRRLGWRTIVSGALSVASYALALFVVRTNPVGPVIALREASVVFAALFGWWFLNEHVTRRRLAGVVAVCAGAVLLVAL